MNIRILLFLFFLPIFSFSQSEFIIGTDLSTNVCEGTLYDSGGENGRYTDNEDFVFTVCPDQPHECIALDLESYNIEEFSDELIIYSGADVNGIIIEQIDGMGTNRQLQLPAGCATFQFISDGSLRFDGFKLNWKCESNPCSPSTLVTCDEPYIIPSLPFEVNNLTTCGAGNSVQLNPCFSFFLTGEEYIFAYDSPGDECILLEATGISFVTGLGVFEDCPDQANDCLAYDEAFAFFGLGEAVIPSVRLENPGRYYFAIANPTICTDFNLKVERLECLDLFPEASQCEDAIPITGCNVDEPVIVGIRPGMGDPNFLIDGINDGCWGNIISPDYTWMYFQAQTDGKFGFILGAPNPRTPSDFDINIWGPISSIDQFCNFSGSREPIRSTYADISGGYELTGLTDVSPIDNSSISDQCEDQDSDGFVTRMDVREGEYYLILINDYDGAFANVGVAIDFSETTPGVLGSPEDDFSISENKYICADDSIQLEAAGGVQYQWLTTNGLSCTDCPNPIASPSQTTTYEVEIEGFCGIDTLETTVFVDDFSFENNQLDGCSGDELIIETGINDQNLIYQWRTSEGILSCVDCLTPSLILPENTGEVIVILEATNGNCVLTDSVFVSVTERATVEIQPNEVLVCKGVIVNLTTLSNATDGNFNWSSGEQTENIEFIAMNDELIIVNFEADNLCGVASDSIQIFVGDPFSIDSLTFIEPENADTLFTGCRILVEPNISPVNTNIVSYEWFINDVSVSDSSLLDYLILEEGNTEIELIISTDDCEASFATSRIVQSSDEIIYPNIFSPNNDGRNDFFRPIISPKVEITSMRIFNRWGGLVYNNDNNERGWDGTFNEENQPPDVYIYQVTIKLPSGEEVPKTGDITLIR